MSVSLYKCSIAVALGSVLLLGAGGCAPSQVTHHSGQIGRYYGDGVCFSVPVVQIADAVQKEDKFWEVRQGIGGADVVVLGPFVTEGSDNYRENMALSSRPVSGVSNVEQLRDELLKSIAEDIPSASGFVKGQDEYNCWVDYTCSEDDKELFCRAFFFYDSERSLGYTLVGTVLNSAKNDNVIRDFASIAETFRIGVPQSGFGCLSDALAEAVAVGSNTAPQREEPVSESETPQEPDAGADASSASADASSPGSDS